MARREDQLEVEACLAPASSLLEDQENCSGGINVKEIALSSNNNNDSSSSSGGEEDQYSSGEDVATRISDALEDEAEVCYSDDSEARCREEDDPVENLYKHIRFLQRCSSDGRLEAQYIKQGIRKGLHPGLFAKLPVVYVTLGSLYPAAEASLNTTSKPRTSSPAEVDSRQGQQRSDDTEMEDWLTARCASCEECLHEISAQVLLELPCGHHIHHECGRKWFAENQHCPAKGCGLAVETHDTLTHEQALDEREQPRVHNNLLEALGSVLSQRNPTALIEYDGIAVDAFSGSLRACSGVFNVKMTAAGRVEFANNTDPSKASKILENLYQGSVVITSTVQPIRHACHLPNLAPLRQSGSVVSRVVPAPGPTRTSSCDETTFSSLVAKRSNAAVEAAAIAASSAQRGVSRLSFAGFKTQLTKAIQSSKILRCKLSETTVLGEPCTCKVECFTQIHSFTVKGGALFQRSAFANAMHMTSIATAKKDADGFAQIPARVLYM